jgi:arylsulfatase A-like enzyme
VTARPRSLILITVDCLRADRVGFLGHPDATPFLDSLAAESIVFKNAIASGVPTYYSLPALLASRYPLALGRDVIGIGPGESTIATELKECGFKTAAFVAGNPYISSAGGYSDGFDVFRNFLSSDQIGFDSVAESVSMPSLRERANRMLSWACHRVPMFGAAYDEIYFQYCQQLSQNKGESLDGLRRFPSADVIVDCATAWINQNSAGPFFLWLHLMDPHAPYYPKAEALQEMGNCVSAAEVRRLNSFWARENISSGRLQKKCSSIQSLYNAGIRWADEQIGRLAQRLAELNLWDQCAMAITADHGEEFLDHGGRFHPPLNLHEELIHVPLLLRVPGITEPRDINQPFGLIDLAPTLFDALDIPAPASFRGRSCWGNLGTNESWSRAVFTECAYGCTNPFHAEKRLAPRLLAVRKGEYKLVMNFVSGADQLFQLSSDPRESHPLPWGTAGDVRKLLLECAKKHVAESYKSRDLEIRLAAQTRELRAEWTQTVASRLN